MDGAPNFDELFENFPDLLEDEVIFQKELLARFGLLFSKYAALEASIQNGYILWQQRHSLADGVIKKKQDWEANRDELERIAFAATFGSLLNLIADFEPILPHLETLRMLKRKRDYFAHHFFREENDKLFSSKATLSLMSKMNKLRKEARAVELEVDTIHRSMMQATYPDKNIPAEIAKDIEERKKLFPKILRWMSDGKDISTVRSPAKA